MFNPNDLPGQDPGKLIPKASSPGKGFKASDLPTFGNTPVGNPVLGGTINDTSFDDFRFQPKFAADNQLLRAQDQKWYEQAGLAIGNGVANTVTGLLEGMGYLGSLATEWGDDRNYSNALTETMRNWHNPLGEIYAERPDQVFDLKDPAWWFSNIQQLAESAGAFAIEGAALGKVFGGLAARAAGAMAKEAQLGRAAVRAAGQTMSAATLAYTEGAMSGYRIYDAAYKTNYQRMVDKGASPEEADERAKQIASHAAATTVQMNTVMNTALNLTALAPMFHSEEDLVETWARKKGQGAMAEGESLAAYKSRLKSAGFDDAALKDILVHRKGLSSLTGEALQEGIEEVNTQYAEAEGKRVGEGKSRSLVESLTDLNRYITDVTNEEGALNFVLGSLGGVAQTALLDRIPIHRVPVTGADGKPLVTKDSEGNEKYQTRLVTARTANEFGVREYFTGIKDSLLKDVNHIEDLNARLIKAVTAKDEVAAANLRDELFAVGALDSVTKGLAENWKQQYRNIAEVDNSKDLARELDQPIETLKTQLTEAQQQAAPAEEIAAIQQQLSDQIKQQTELEGKTDAILKGYAKDMKDMSYKQKAERAIADLDALHNMHQQVQRDLVDQFNPVTAELADHVFLRKADLYLRKNNLNRFKEELDAMELAELDASADTVERERLRHLNYAGAWERTSKKMQEDVNQMQTLAKRISDGDTAAVRELTRILSKYRPVGYNETDLGSAVKAAVDSINRRYAQMEASIKKSEEDLKTLSGFSAWLERNPGKTWKDFMSDVSGNQIFEIRKSNYDRAVAEHAIAEENLQHVLSAKGQQEFIQRATEHRNQLVAELNKKNQTYNDAMLLKMQDKKAVAEMSVKSKTVLAQKLEKQLADKTSELNELVDKLNGINRELKELGVHGILKLNKVIPLKQQQTRLKREITSVQTQIDSLREQLALLDAKIDAGIAQAAEPVTPENVEETPEPNPEDYIQEQPEDDGIPHPDEKPKSSYTADDFQLDPDNPEDAYIMFWDTLSPAAGEALERLQNEMVKSVFSLNRYNQIMSPLVKAGQITEEQKSEGAVVLRQYLEHLKQPAETMATQPVVDVTESTGLAADEYVEPFPAESEEIFINDSLANEDELTSDFFYEDVEVNKTADAISAATSGIKYVEGVIPGTDKVVIRTEYNEDGGPALDPQSSKALLIHNKVQKGDEVILQVDKDYKGTRRVMNRLATDEDGNPAMEDDSFDQYTDGTSIRMTTKPGENWAGFADVPIKIIHKKTGEVIGYLRTASWVNQTKGAGNYRNMTDLFPADENGNRMEGNVQFQTDRLLAIRKKIAHGWNKDKNYTITTRITARGKGYVFHNGELTESTLREKVKLRQASNSLSDPNLVFGIAHKISDSLTFGVDRGVPFDGPLQELTEKQKQKFAGAPVVFLPMPDGSHKVQPLLTAKFDTRGRDMNTLLRAIELHLQAGVAEDALFTKHMELMDKTGFDIRTKEGLQNLINQHYTFTNQFKDGTTAVDAPAINGKKELQFMFAVTGDETNVKALIKAGVAFGGKLAKAQLVDGKLSDDFVSLMKSGFEGKLDGRPRFKTVTFTKGDIKGVNNNSPITEVGINVDGKTWSKTHPNYNAYLKSFTRTSVYGKHQVNGTYVYGANSSVILDDGPIFAQSEVKVVASPAELPTGDGANEELSAEEIAALMESTRNASLFAPSAIKPVIQPVGEELTYENLKKLQDLVADPNGLPVYEVLERLQKLGITHIPDGYNPFVKCS
ncbi:MAG: hypothetical protein HYU71_06380 [Bacteroidetes bacterium]|nr:hypothetical protein [Bacteroidota bacterium]